MTSLEVLEVLASIEENDKPRWARIKLREGKTLEVEVDENEDPHADEVDIEDDSSMTPLQLSEVLASVMIGDDLPAGFAISGDDEGSLVHLCEVE